MTLYMPLPLQSELVIVDCGGLSESNVVPKSHRESLFSLEPSGEVCASDDSLSGEPVSLSLS